jgi:hypothetical protein
LIFAGAANGIILPIALAVILIAATKIFNYERLQTSRMDASSWLVSCDCNELDEHS